MIFNREQAVSALVTLATVLFLMAVAPRFPYRRQARIAAVTVYGVALIGVVIWVVLWAAGVQL